MSKPAALPPRPPTSPRQRTDQVRVCVFIQLHESLPFPPGIPKFPSPSGIPPSAKPSPFLLLPAYPALIRHVWIVYAVLNHGGIEASAKLCFMPYQSFTRSSLRPTERRSRVQESSKIAVQRGLAPENYIQTALIPITATSTGLSNPLPTSFVPCCPVEYRACSIWLSIARLSTPDRSLLHRVEPRHRIHRLSLPITGL